MGAADARTPSGARARAIDGGRARGRRRRSRKRSNSGRSELEEAQRVLQRMWWLGQQITLELNPKRVLERFLEAVSTSRGRTAAAVGLIGEDGNLHVVVGTGMLARDQWHADPDGRVGDGTRDSERRGVDRDRRRRAHRASLRRRIRAYAEDGIARSGDRSDFPARRTNRAV